MSFDNEAIRAARQAKHLSQQDLAVKANVGPGTIERLERGQHEDPQLGTILRLARALDVEPSTLVRE